MSWGDSWSTFRLVLDALYLNNLDTFQRCFNSASFKIEIASVLFSLVVTNDLDKGSAETLKLGSKALMHS